MSQQQTVLVTGGAGYIGSHTIIELLRQTDYHVVSIDNLVNSTAVTFDRIEKITGVRVVNHEIDLTLYEEVRRVFSLYPKIAGVIHFAALKSVGESVEQPYLYYHNNIASLINVLRACDELQIANFIFSSSCSVYGNVAVLPVTESTPLQKPESPYAHTKQLGEEIIEHFVKYKDMKAINLRYFNPVGADKSGLIGENPRSAPNNLVPVITQTAIGKREKMFVFGCDYPTRDGSCIRDYIHVSDIADAHLKALAALKNGKVAKLDTFNLGSGQGVSVLEAIRTFEEVSGVKPNYELSPRRAGDVVAVYSDSNKAYNILGWQPVYSVRDMMQTAWTWELNLYNE